MKTKRLGAFESEAVYTGIYSSELKNRLVYSLPFDYHHRLFRRMMSIISGLIPTQTWIQTYISDPYWEGAERLKRGIYGENRHLLSQPKLSLGERIVNLTLGLLLIIPLINTIVWIAMQVFGDPEFLSSPYVYRPASEPRLAMELKRPKAISIPCRRPSPILEKPLFKKRELKVVAAAPLKESLLPTKASYIDDKRGRKETAAWTFKTQNDELLAVAKAPSARTESYYKSGWIQKYHYIGTSKKEGELQLTLEGTTLHLEAAREMEAGKKTQKLVQTFNLGKTPWIQQTTLGLKNFIQSKQEQTLEFYGIHPEEFTLTSLTAIKRKIETLPGHGAALHVQIYLYSIIPVVNAWFNPENGLLLKSSAATGLFSRMTTELIPESL